MDEAATVADRLGWAPDDANTALAALATAGLNGSDAATSLIAAVRTCGSFPTLDRFRAHARWVAELSSCDRCKDWRMRSEFGTDGMRAAAALCSSAD